MELFYKHKNTRYSCTVVMNILTCFQFNEVRRCKCHPRGVLHDLLSGSDAPILFSLPVGYAWLH